MKQIILITSHALVAVVLMNGSHAQEPLSDQEIERLLDRVAEVSFRGFASEDLIKEVEEAKAALRLLGDKLLPHLLARLHQDRVHDVVMFRTVLPSGIPEVIEMAQNSLDAPTRRRLVGLMGWLAPDGAEPETVDMRLVSALERFAVEDDDAEVRADALGALRNLRVAAGEMTIAKALRDDDERVRCSAVYALVYWPDAAKREALLRQMAGDESHLVRLAVGMTSEVSDVAAPLLEEAVTAAALPLWQIKRAKTRLRHLAELQKE